jgi:hypothetical protein
MVDRRAKKAEFQSAVRSKDVYALARIFQSLPPVAAQPRGQPTNPQQEHLRIDDTDWSVVLSAWMNICEAVETVSNKRLWKASNDKCVSAHVQLTH